MSSKKKVTARDPTAYQSRTDVDKNIIKKEDEIGKPIEFDATEKKNIEDYIKKAMTEAQALWDDVKVKAKTDGAFEGWEDKRKVDYFRDVMNYKNFMNDYPITSRCMIIGGQYSAKAFKRFLLKCKSIKHPPDDRRAKGYMEDQWLRRQADYVRYLWEEYQKGHFNVRDAQEKWQDAYTNLKTEMDDFRDKHDEVKQQVAEEKKLHKKEILQEMMDRIRNNQQNLPEEGQELLIELFRKAKDKKKAPVETSDENTGIRVIKHNDPVCVDQQGNLLSEAPRVNEDAIKESEEILKHMGNGGDG